MYRIVEPQYCTAETDRTLYINYTGFKMKNRKKTHLIKTHKKEKIETEKKISWI